jgi:hypothetical protein
LQSVYLFIIEVLNFHIECFTLVSSNNEFIDANHTFFSLLALSRSSSILLHLLFITSNHYRSFPEQLKEYYEHFVLFDQFIILKDFQYFLDFVELVIEMFK